ncbi:type II secretion system F family protein [Myceligenerans pegani]|uniref:Type II secretion system F family protein n=1 Tax=Myceligenerans pegani TaxID=2776917 RepID=A0ABR9N0H8_9MICO|nr:type II secretion system F family protein [Myceligenerans sp. TRM 65318]MBE1877155.1 type II secretion system F family protein [Myceligenerans sp. TRM 65318]MBE3019426.1 type II secretion system F family protein [Myceligenerans sp. TRM 65318]
MGVVVGLLLGAGVWCLWWSWWERPVGPRPGAGGARTRELLAQAGLPHASPAALYGATGAAALGAGLIVLAATRSPALALCFAALAALGPRAGLRARARARTRSLRAMWPDVVDHLASGVRAGLSLPEAVAQLAERGPIALREPFAQFARDFRASGRFGDSLTALKDRLADPVADRIVEALRITHDVGGRDLGRLLRTLSGFLRDDLRTRGELEARQSWTVNGARVAVAGPWLILALLATRPGAVGAYDTPAGAAVLIAGVVCSFAAYRVMLRVGRLPAEARVLR